MKLMMPTRRMERAVLERDRAFDGSWFVAVRTTDIFCVPSCPARKPLPGNMAFFTTADEARQRGYRPCLRCHPLDLDRTPQWASDLVARLEASPATRIPDSELRSLGVEPARLRRYFHRAFGMTFQEYSRTVRMREAHRRILEGASLDTVAFDCGYESYSGFREAFQKITGTTPARAGGDWVVTTVIPSPLGAMVAGATSGGLCLLEFADQSRLQREINDLRSLLKTGVAPGTNPHLERLRRELAAYFSGELREFTIPLVSPGTPFLRSVWAALRGIPYGETIPYEELAMRVGKSPGASRAVGQANGKNRISIVIPCHRVIAKSGTLGGYGGGLWRKQALLEIEGAMGGTLPLPRPVEERGALRA